MYRYIYLGLARETFSFDGDVLFQLHKSYTTEIEAQ